MKAVAFVLKNLWNLWKLWSSSKLIFVSLSFWNLIPLFYPDQQNMELMMAVVTGKKESCNLLKSCYFFSSTRNHKLSKEGKRNQIKSRTCLSICFAYSEFFSLSFHFYFLFLTFFLLSSERSRDMCKIICVVTDRLEQASKAQALVWQNQNQRFSVPATCNRVIESNDLDYKHQVWRMIDQSVISWSFRQLLEMEL